MHKKVLFWILLFAMLQATLLWSQWSNDPAVNTAICTLGGEQAIPKIVVGPSGDYYISWFSNDSGNYDVRLQRLDADGNALWDDNGILISNHPAMSWLTDWDMAIDADNNVILTFQDIRNGGNNNVYAYRIAPDGTFVWGADGLELSNTTYMDAAPKAAVASNGDAVISWHNDIGLIMQRISPDGTLLWGDEGILLSGTDAYTWPQIIPVEDGNVILKYFVDSGPFYAPTRHVFAQKYDTAGTALWTDPTVISNAGGISAWTQIFSIVSDNANGLFIGWHEDRDNNNNADVYVQHVFADGSVDWAPNGILASTQTNSEHYYPKLAYQSGEDALYVYWNEMDADQNNRGLNLQKIDTSGTLLWGNNGMTVVPLMPDDVYLYAAGNDDQKIVAFYEQGTTGTQVKAVAVNNDGTYSWTGNSVTLSSVANGVVHPVVSPLANGQWVSTWEDSRDADVNIYAQNLNCDGTLGLNTPPQTGTIQGTVTFDQGPGSPADATITAGGYSVTPDASGEYQMVVEVGTYTVSGQAQWYYAQDAENVVVNAGEVTTVDFNFYYLMPPANPAVDPNSGFVTWDVPQHDPSLTLLHYNVFFQGESFTTTDLSYQLSGLINGMVYTVGLQTVYEEGESAFIEVSFLYLGTSAVDVPSPGKVMLNNYPNPFNPSTVISCALTSEIIAQNTAVAIEIFNAKGQKVTRLEVNLSDASTDASQGFNTVTTTWNGSDNSNRPVASGLYYYRLQAGNTTLAQSKMLLMK
jgi:hypothetical protein